MEINKLLNVDFSIEKSLKRLKHYLPTQAPLKDFVHHNTLHAFQHEKFHEGIQMASHIFGYSVYLPANEFHEKFKAGEIDEAHLKAAFEHQISDLDWNEHKDFFLKQVPTYHISSQVGKMRKYWKSIYHVNLDKLVHPILFRLISNYLDQGVSIWNFPNPDEDFLNSILSNEILCDFTLFKSKRVRALVRSGNTELEYLLKILVGLPEFYERYLFDQQFEHPGWSGMVSILESNPTSLYQKRNITLKEFIELELLLEIDALDSNFKGHWEPLGKMVSGKITPKLFKETSVKASEKWLSVYQEALEFTYYDRVLSALVQNNPEKQKNDSFQAVFCVDDRECSIRRYLEKLDSGVQTFGSAGFFNLPIYFQPAGAKFFTKVCPAPLNPKHLICEIDQDSKSKRELHFNKSTQNPIWGLIWSQSFGFWSALKLFGNLFKLSLNSTNTYSFHHMNKDAKLSIDFDESVPEYNGLQIGYKTEEKIQVVEGLLRSIGLTKDFATHVYLCAHGASSVNNTYYAGYDCGACSGRPGSVNARVVAAMANDTKVRAALKEKGIDIPETTVFIGALRDTTRDEIEFFLPDNLSLVQLEKHKKHVELFAKAHEKNARERLRRFENVSKKGTDKSIHEKIKRRSVSVFEPRPEYNHATNALCVIGRRELTQSLFLDRRSFLSSYDYRSDLEGELLLPMIRALSPVCGGINLEYYFSRVDNQKLGSGSKLPHNVIGLIGVSNGVEGDLRTGLPSQMVEIHDPIRMCIIVEHYPDVVLSCLQKDASVMEWYKNEWMHLLVIHPESKRVFRLNTCRFEEHEFEILPIANKPDIPNGIEWTEFSGNINPFTF